MEMAAAVPCQWADLPCSVLSCVLANLSATQAQLGASRACTAWRSAALQIWSQRAFVLRAFVTLAAENRVVVLVRAFQVSLRCFPGAFRSFLLVFSIKLRLALVVRCCKLAPHFRSYFYLGQGEGGEIVQSFTPLPRKYNS